jgi:hypothetical protein
MLIGAPVLIHIKADVHAGIATQLADAGNHTRGFTYTTISR